MMSFNNPAAHQIDQMMSLPISTFNDNFHKLLNTNSYNLEEIRNFLKCDHSSINVPGVSGKTPLVIVLENSECSVDIVKLLLQYGAFVNGLHFDPLHTALKYNRDEAIIQLLLEKGASIEYHDDTGRTAFRYIFCNCNFHQSAGNFKWKENVLNLLLEAGLDLNKPYDYGRSPLCYALYEGADVRDIELLLSKGGSLNACRAHASPLHCLTCFCPGYLPSGALVKASVVQLLCNKQVREGKVPEMSIEPLKNALSICRYETDAIRLLLEHSDGNAVDRWIQQEQDFLHRVVRNPKCKTSIVKLFLQRGARLDKLNQIGQTALHTAMEKDRHYLSVIDFLLKSGAPVDAKCCLGITPLCRALSNDIGIDVINLLLTFGAKIGEVQDRDRIFKLLIRYEYDQDKKCVFKTLVKYYLLEVPDFNIQALIEGHSDYESLSVFAAKCADEVQKMESNNLRSDCTLRRFINENFLLNVKTDQEIKAANDDCNQLLKILSSNEFPEYFDVITSQILVSKVGEVFLKKNLQELIMYTEDYSPVKACLMKKVVLNNDCVRKLALFLSDKELLCLIVAFYHAGDLTYDNNSPEKRDLNSKLFTKFEKRRKLDQ